MKRGVVVLLSLIALSLILGSVLGQPILLSYVESGSMEPALSVDDGFIAVPTQLDDSIREGDIVVFESKTIQGGGLTTHRVVDITDGGYITKGDSNPFTDQDSGEPIVKRGQIVAKAMQFNGRVIVIPMLGVVIEGTQAVLRTIGQPLVGIFGSGSAVGVQGLAYLFFAIALLWYVIGESRPINSRARERTSSRTNDVDTKYVVGALTALLLIGSTVAMVVPAGTQEFGVVSSEFESESPTVIPKGDSETIPYPVGNGGLLPVVSFLEPASDGVKIDPSEIAVPAGSALNASITLHAPPETGYYRRYVTEHRYLAMLPQSTIRGLYEFHPWAPIAVIDAVIAVPFYLLGVRLVGRARIRRDRSRESSQSIVTRAGGFVTNLY